MNILGIETSCDETAAAIVKDGREVLSNIINSQIDIHTKYGGVVPEIASRNHLMDLPIVVSQALEEANMTFNDIDAIAVTNGPGLVGALLIGVSYAKGLASTLDIPIIGVNHLEGHISANYITNKELEPPFLCLVVSGGHTNLILVNDYTDLKVLGRSLDDAAGEAYDKIARVIGLGYPGGPKLEKEAESGNPKAIEFPRVLLDKDSFDFSFSGLKSSVLNYVNSSKQKGIEINSHDLAASFQQAILDVLIEKTLRAAKEFNINKVAIAGGVSANKALRKQLTKALDENDIEIYSPEFIYSTDNAAMIAAQGYYDYINGNISDNFLDAVPNLTIE